MSKVTFKKREIIYRPYEPVMKTIVDIVMVICLAFLVVLALTHKTTVDGNSMSPKLNPKDVVLINKAAYSFSSPERYDLIVFEQKDIDGKITQYIKRIIGLPGETVRIDNGSVYINDQKLEDDVIPFEIYNAGLAAEPIKLAYNEYFVLGDNRNNSNDSRFSDIGMVTRNEIIGKPWMCVSPINDFGIITDRVKLPNQENQTESESGR